MSADQKRLPRWVRNLFFGLSALALTLLLVWQVKELLSYIRPEQSREAREPAQLRITQHAALVPGDLYFSDGSGTYQLSQPLQSEYSFLKFLGQEMLQQALHSEEGRSVGLDGITAEAAGFLYLYTCPLPAQIFEELGAPDLFLSAYPAAGINEIRFFPAAYYWQDSVVIVCNREAGFFWKFVIYGKNRTSADQANLDYFVELFDPSRTVAETYIQSLSGLMTPADGEYFSKRSFEAVSYFQNDEGFISESAASAYANRVFSYADTMDTWSFSQDTTVFTNEYATLRVQSDGSVFYSGLGVHDSSALMLAAYEAAYEFVQRPLALSYSAAITLRPVSYTTENSVFTFTFAYYYRGMRIEGLKEMTVSVRNTDIINFTGGIYRFTVKSMAEQDYQSNETWFARFTELNPDRAPSFCWVLYEDNWYPALSGGDEPLLPFELPSEEEIPEEGIPSETGEESSAEPEVAP